MLKRYAWLDTFLRAHSGVTYDWKEEWQWHRYLLDGKLFAALGAQGLRLPPPAHGEMRAGVGRRPAGGVPGGHPAWVLHEQDPLEHHLPGWASVPRPAGTVLRPLLSADLQQAHQKTPAGADGRINSAKEHPAIGWVLCHRWDSCARSGQSRRSVRKCSSAGFWLSFSQAAMISSSSPSPTSGTNTRLSAW